MEAVVRLIFRWMPLLFGFGFIAPLIAQTMAYWGWAAPFGLSRVVFGLIVGGAWGSYTMIRGRWV